jgi:hypothetical protein
MGFVAMSRIRFSFDSNVAAVAAKPEVQAFRAARRREIPIRRRMRDAMENFGLFAFGFGAATLLIHFAVGFFGASRMSSMFPPLNL